MDNKDQQASLIPNMQHGSIESEIYSEMDDTELVEFLKQQLEQDQEEQLQQTSTRGKRRGKRHAPVLETEEGKTLKDYILKLKKYSKNFDDEPAVFKAQTGFRNKNLLTFDSICESVS
ncbi:hypothetical protein, partial [Borrelia persica]|uniref:hypothetical protein n=1 Tax=Borrelia persica TaxID=44448 RepID=UPI000462F673